MKIGMIHPEDGAAGSPGVSVNFYQITGVMKNSNIFTLMYVCPCIIYENDESYQLDATIYLLL